MSVRITMKKVASSVLTGLVAGGGLALLAALVGPAGAAHAATATCIAPPSDLYAVAGNATFGTLSVRVWGYSTTPGASVNAPGGPTLCVTAGASVSITLHNELKDALGTPLTENTALLFQGQSLVPDRTGAAPAPTPTTKTYTFTAGKPGTYLYEAGLVPNAQHQVAMGLYGALIVRPNTASPQAYDDPSTAYTDEAVLVLSEVDPALNNRSLTLGGPATFDMRKFAPRYSLINGKAYPNTDPIVAGAGNKVLVRYVNAGIGYHSAAVLGAEQTVIALDGSPLNISRKFVAETFGPGQTADTLVTAPPALTVENRLAVYDGSLLLHNSNTPGTGGMLTFLSVPASATAPPAAGGPVTSAVAYTAGTLGATVTSTAGTTITTVEYYLDSVTGTPTGTMTAGATGSYTAAVSAPNGQHIIYVRGQDSALTWGPFSSVLVTGADATGPTTKSPLLTPALTNGSVPVAVHATGDDTATGGSNIAAAEYFIDTVGADGAGATMAVNLAAPIASLDATIAQPIVNALSAGTHTISIHAKDSVSPTANWGPMATVTLTVNKTGPTTTAVLAAPNPNNGTLAFNASTPGVRVSATMTDPLSNISAAEGFIDTVTADGTGIVLSATDGLYNGLSEAGYFDIPLATVAQLSNGTHTISVHAKNAAGVWGGTGGTATTTLLIDKTAPTVSGVAASPNPTLGATTVNLTATATDAATAVTRAEWFTGTDPGFGNGTAMTLTGTGNLSASIDVSNFNEGAYTLNVRAQDAAGNWSLNTSTVLQVRGPLYFSTFGNTNPPGVAGTADDADIYNWNGTAFSRATDVTAITNPLPGGANVDGYDRVDATHFYMSFSADTTVPGLGAVQDEDVVYYNAGTWSVYFDGTARGLTAANQDVDAISVVGAPGGTGGTLYFSTFGNTNPTGVGGAADDADIYSWAYGTTGATPFTRVIDASAAPYTLPAAANVDGFVRVDATHFYLSFSADTTTVPVLGAVQDEDVIYYNNGTWSVYFDGTAHGLTAANHDVDAFDLP